MWRRSGFLRCPLSRSPSSSDRSYTADNLPCSDAPSFAQSSWDKRERDRARWMRERAVELLADLKAWHRGLVLRPLSLLNSSSDIFSRSPDVAEYRRRFPPHLQVFHSAPDAKPYTSFRTCSITSSQLLSVVAWKVGSKKTSSAPMRRQPATSSLICSGLPEKIMRFPLIGLSVGW
jgi:hypothetical protein